MSETKKYPTATLLLVTALLVATAVFLAASRAQELVSFGLTAPAHARRDEAIVKTGDNHPHIEKVIAKSFVGTHPELTYASPRRDMHLTTDEVQERQPLFERWWFAVRFMLAVTGK